MVLRIFYKRLAYLFTEALEFMCSKKKVSKYQLLLIILPSYSKIHTQDLKGRKNKISWFVIPYQQEDDCQVGFSLHR